MEIRNIVWYEAPDVTDYDDLLKGWSWAPYPLNQSTAALRLPHLQRDVSGQMWMQSIFCQFSLLPYINASFSFVACSWNPIGYSGGILRMRCP